MVRPMQKPLMPTKKYTLSNGKVIKEKYSLTPLIILILLILTYYSGRVTGFDFGQLISRWQEFFVIIGQMIPPDWSRMSSIYQPLIDTIKMSFLGSFLGALTAIPMAYFAATSIQKNVLVSSIAKIILSILRTLPTLVTALVATYLLGLGTFAGTVAIFLFTVAYVGKLLYEQIESVDMNPYEAMQSIGMNKLQSFRYAVFPQVLPKYLSTSLFCFEGNVRYAAILGYVGAGGIGLLLNERLAWRDYSSVGMILLSLILTVIIIETVSEHFRKRLV